MLESNGKLRKKTNPYGKLVVGQNLEETLHLLSQSLKKVMSGLLLTCTVRWASYWTCYTQDPFNEVARPGIGIHCRS